MKYRPSLFSSNFKKVQLCPQNFKKCCALCLKKNSSKWIEEMLLSFFIILNFSNWKKQTWFFINEFVKK